MCSVYTVNATQDDCTTSFSHFIVCNGCLERQTNDCYQQLSSRRWPVKVPLCHVGPRGHILALGCQRWAAVWIPAAFSPAAPWCLTALTDEKRAAQERAFGSGGSSSPTLSRVCCIFFDLLNFPDAGVEPAVCMTSSMLSHRQLPVASRCGNSRQ